LASLIFGQTNYLKKYQKKPMTFNAIHKKYLLLFCLFLLSQPVFAYSQKSFINQLLSSHQFFEKELINLQIKQIEMQGDKDNYGAWEADISAELARIEKHKLRDEYTSSTDYAQRTDKNVKKIGLDISKKFFSNGSLLKFSADKSLPTEHEELYDKNGYQKDDFSAEYLEDLSVSWALPLLKNKDGVIEQKTYDLAVLDFADEKLVLAEAQEDFLNSKMTEFIDWVSFKWQIKKLSQTLNRLTKIHAKAEQDYPRDVMILTKSINKHQRSLLSFKSKLASQTGLLIASIASIDFKNNPPTLPVNFRLDLIKNLKKYCQDNVRDLQRVDIEKQVNQRRIKSYENAKLADFDLTLSAARDEDIGTSSSYLKSVEYEYEAKLVLSYPLSGDVNNQVYLDKYRLQRRQIELEYNNKLIDILALAHKLDTDIRHGLKQSTLIKKQIQAFKESSEVNLYLNDQGEARFVIVDLEDYLELETENIDTLISLYKDKLAYDNLLDRLLPRRFFE
jgi:hypothetical protein